MSPAALDDRYRLVCYSTTPLGDLARQLATLTERRRMCRGCGRFVRPHEVTDGRVCLRCADELDAAGILDLVAPTARDNDRT